MNRQIKQVEPQYTNLNSTEACLGQSQAESTKMNNPKLFRNKFI